MSSVLGVTPSKQSQFDRQRRRRRKSVNFRLTSKTSPISSSTIKQDLIDRSYEKNFCSVGAYSFSANLFLPKNNIQPLSNNSLNGKRNWTPARRHWMKERKHWRNERSWWRNREFLRCPE